MLKLKKKNLFTLVGCALLFFFIFSLIPTLRPAGLTIFTLPLYLFNAVKNEFCGIIFFHRNFTENSRLEKENDLLKFKLNAVNEVYLENKRLKGLLSFKLKSPYRVVASRVIARSPDNWQQAVIIDKGDSSGIKRGEVVISYLGLVGRIIETSRFTSKVMLINDPNLGVSAVDQRSRQEGLVCGTLGNSLVMKYLPNDSDVKASDIILTSGLTNAYPKGLLIGSVVDVGEEFSGLSHYAIIKPAVALSNLEEVLIIIA